MKTHITILKLELLRLIEKIHLHRMIIMAFRHLLPLIKVRSHSIIMWIEKGVRVSGKSTVGYIQVTVGNPVVTTHKRYSGPSPLWQTIWAGLSTALVGQVQTPE